MGFIKTYNNRNRLVFACEAGYEGCQRTGCTAITCKFNYCQRVYVCKACKPAYKKASADHDKKGSSCDLNHQRFIAERRVEQTAIDAGQLVRKAARFVDDDNVKVLFVGKDSRSVVYKMLGTTYDSYPRNVVATPEDYKTYGTLTLCDTF
jgi:hypothetical protein